MFLQFFHFGNHIYRSKSPGNEHPIGPKQYRKTIKARDSYMFLARDAFLPAD